MLQRNFKQIFHHQASRLYSVKVATKAEQKTNSEAAAKTTTPALITCKNSQLNLIVPEKASSPFGSIPLASKGWMHYKAKQDYFIINRTTTEHSQQAEMKSFEELQRVHGMSLQSELQKNLQDELDVTKLTEIQFNSLPKVYAAHHVLIAAETGCGKTLAYLLPIAQRVLELKQREQARLADNSLKESRKMNSPLAIIITPGRELATQIADVANKLCSNTGVNIKVVLGGNTKRLMLQPEFEDVDIMVATIGALSKLVTTGIYKINQVRHLVLDEADTLLDESFQDKLQHFLRKFPLHKNEMQNEHTVGTQLILASATMPTNVDAELKSIINLDTLHQVVSNDLHKLMPHVQQKFLRMSKINRPPKLLEIVKSELAKNRPLIIFSNKSAASDYVSIFLNNCGVNCLNLNGDMMMKIRLGRFEQFQSGACDVLSTTDIGSRGLDTRRARHVINFDFPLHICDYIHRVGRIGRVGHQEPCFVTNFVSSRREVDVVQRIEHTARTGGILPDVNANIKNIINQRIIKDMKAAGIPPPQAEVEF